MPVADLQPYLRFVSRRDEAAPSNKPQLSFSSIEDGGINEYDADGILGSTFGQQFDGTHTVVSFAGPPPPQPTAPQVTPGPMNLTVRWNGMFADGALSPMDFSHVEVHVSAVQGFEPTPQTLKTTLRGELGDESVISPLTAKVWYVKFIARSRSTKPSPPSVESSGTPEEISDTAANGKITVEDYAPTLADGAGKPVNATWSQLDPQTGAQIAFFRWTGTEWVDMPLSEAIVPKINIGEGVYGTLKGVNLGAQTFVGANITGALIQTQAEAFSGLKMDATTNKLQAFNPAGAPTVVIDGNTGELTATGTFRTGTSGSRVEITQEESGGLGGLDAHIALYSGTSADYGVLLNRDGEIIPGDIKVVSQTMLQHHLGDSDGGATLSLSEASVNLNHKYNSGRRSGELTLQRAITGLYHSFDGDPMFRPVLSDVELTDDSAVLRKRSASDGTVAATVYLDNDLAQLSTHSGGSVDARFYCMGDGWAKAQGKTGVHFADENVWTSSPINLLNEEWHEVGYAGEPPFENGYGNDPGMFNPLSFKRDIAGRVWLAGTISPVNNGAVIFTLPPDYHPLVELGGFLVFWQGATPARYGELKIYEDGSVIFWVSGNAGGSYVTIGGVSWET